LALSLLPTGSYAGESEIDLGQFWLLDFQLVAVRPAVVDEGRVTGGAVYWYMLYTVENRDKEAHTLPRPIRISATSDPRIPDPGESDKEGARTYACIHLPDVERAAEIREARALVGPADFREALKAKGEGDDSKYKALMEVKPGEKRHCVATFNRIDPEADRVEILVRGLTNHVHVDVLDDGRRRVSERALKIVVERPGDEFAHGLDRFRFVRKEWTTVSVVIPPVGS
jgi:hypothetical protein